MLIHTKIIPFVSTKLCVVILCDIITQMENGIGKPTSITEKSDIITKMSKLKIDH